MISVEAKPAFTPDEAVGIGRSFYGLIVQAEELSGERDQNFRLLVDGEPRYVLKLSNLEESLSTIEFQQLALDRLAGRVTWLGLPVSLPDLKGNRISEISLGGGQYCYARLLTYLPGRQLTSYRPIPIETWNEVGAILGKVDTALVGLSHPAAHRLFQWNPTDVADVISGNLPLLRDGWRRKIIAHFLESFLSSVHPLRDQIRAGIIHNDGHEHNFLANRGESGLTISGLVDFGDMVYGPYACEPAVAGAYAMMDCQDPIDILCQIVLGYHAHFPLRFEEIEAIYHLACIRLCNSVTLAVSQRADNPDNKYLSISEQSGWRLLDQLVGYDPAIVQRKLRKASGFEPDGRKMVDVAQLRKERSRLLAPSLSLSYRQPLHIVRGFGQYLYDRQGRRYLDCVNNVAHVGHCHPAVVKAGQDQMALLNTNTRYLHENLVRYAGRLLDLFPDPLEVCYFVCSGSEANELALRLARTHTGRTDIIVVDGAYHGNTNDLIAISPYKFSGPGGQGAANHVHVTPMPDVYRGQIRADQPDPGWRYAMLVEQKLEAMHGRGQEPAAFIVEPYLGCGGQICPPDGYLNNAFAHVREAGGICIADEVQVGFGRVGSHFWGFESQQATPDIVTLGKPMGNGHPLAAVITTRKIAESFANGMEYFNTFGGNPVSCAIGEAVLDVIVDEGLQENALRTGETLLDGLVALQTRHALIGDVRGHGLFAGIELVRDRKTLEPAASEATEMVERMKQLGFLLSTDGPLRNVIKVKPPMVITQGDIDQLVDAMDNVLSSDEFRPRR